MTERAEKAQQIFLQGFNCSQSVAVVFADVMHLDEKTILKISAGFGGGFGRLREVCGAFSGATMVLSMLLGYDEITKDEKKQMYEVIQHASKSFVEQNGFLRCRDLLGLDKDKVCSPTPQERTQEYYKKRPCKEIVASAVMITEEILKQHNINI